MGASSLRLVCSQLELDLLLPADLALLHFVARTCNDVDTAMSNFGVHTLGDVELTFEDRMLLAKGLRFVPAPPKPTLASQRSALRHSVTAFHRLLRLRLFFADSPRTPRPLFRVPNPAWLPAERSPPLEAALSLSMAAIKTRLDSTDHLLRMTYPRSNLTRQDVRALARIRDMDVVIRPADKNLGVTVMSRTWYDAEVQRQMASEAYAPAHSVPPQRIIAIIRNRLDALVHRHRGQFYDIARDISPNLPTFLFQHSSQRSRKPPKVPRFYLLPKLHKTPPKGRPIVASVQWITTPASRALDTFLQPLVSAVATRVLTDTPQLIRLLEDTPLPDNAILFSADVESLYTSIPADDCKLAIAHWLRVAEERHLLTHLPWWPRHRQPRDVIPFLQALVELVLDFNFFTIGPDADGNPTMFRQRVGMAMGTQFAPVGANLFMAWVEDVKLGIPALLNSGKLRLWRRYIDDIFGVWTGTRAELEAFFSALPLRYPRIRLTHEVDAQAINFMDLHLYKGRRFSRRGLLDMAVHRKRLNRYLYLPWTSAHPRHMKSAFIKAELMRFVRNSSSFDKFLVDVRLFAGALRARGYPSAFIRRVFTSVSYDDRPKMLAVKDHPSTRQHDTPLTFVHEHTPFAKAMGAGTVLTLTRQSLSRVAATAPDELQPLLATASSWIAAKTLPTRLSSRLHKSWPSNFAQPARRPPDRPGQPPTE